MSEQERSASSVTEPRPTRHAPIESPPEEPHLTAHHVYELVREIRPRTFSPRAHGPGHRIVYAEQKARLYKSGFLSALHGRKDERHFFVKRWPVPKEVKDWRFHWSQGTSAVSLDFEAQFVLQANEESQALHLVETLAEGTEPGEALYGIINASLHEAMDQLARDCDRRELSLLDCFQRTTSGVGESEELSRKVSEQVTGQLKGATFRIGLRLSNMPPLQISLPKQTDRFTLAGSKREHLVETQGLARLVNYQAYKKSRLQSEAEVREVLSRSITEAVHEQLFGRPYYAVVRSFRRGETSVEKQTQARVNTEASSIGYQVKLQQGFADIAALKLLEPTRIDISPEERKYFLSHSNSYVQMSVSLSVQLKHDFEGLHLLIEPDQSDVTEPIKAMVRQTCFDTIQRFNREQFNLHFQDAIEPDLWDAIVERLGTYGLAVTPIHLTQVPSEDAHRYLSLRGRTVSFEADISPHADAGNADGVSIRGNIEVIGMTRNCWERFESKDFGYREVSHVSESWMRQRARLREVALPEQTPLTSAERRALAIELELLEIRDRVVSTLNESLSKIPDLATSWRTLQDSRANIAEAQRHATQAIEAEFGLSIALRGMQREDTDTEGTRRVFLQKRHVLARELLGKDVTRELRLREVADEHAADARERAGVRRLELLEGPEMAPLSTAAEELVNELRADLKQSGLTSQEALNLLPSRTAQTQLPGANPVPGATPEDPSSDPPPQSG